MSFPLHIIASLLFVKKASYSFDVVNMTHEYGPSRDYKSWDQLIAPAVEGGAIQLKIEMTVV